MTERGARRAFLLGASVVFLSACRGDAAPVTLPSLEGLRLDSLFAVGAPTGEESFGGIWDVEAAPDGRLAVLDLEAPAVRVFDASGALVGSISATGVAEGTLDRPSGIAWSRNGELLVWDQGNSWVSFFSVTDAGVELTAARRAFAFGETGFCATPEHVYLSYWQDGQVVHEIGTEGLVRSFGPAPDIPGLETLGPELQEIATEELTPSGLLCTLNGVFEASYFGSRIRMHDHDGQTLWDRELDDFNPMSAYTLDGIGLGRAFDQSDGSHLLRSIVPWGSAVALVQHQLRTSEFSAEGDVEVFESRLLGLENGAELGRTRELPLILAAEGTRLYSVSSDPYPQVVVWEAQGPQ